VSRVVVGRRGFAWVGLAALLCLWAGTAHSQPRVTPLPAEQAASLKKNRALVQQLVEGAVELSGTNDVLSRVHVCNRITASLAKELQEAIQAGDAKRVHELAIHLSGIMERSLAPTVREARQAIQPGSKDEARLLLLQNVAVGLTDNLERSAQAYRETAIGNDLQEVMRRIRASRQHVEQATKLAER